MKEAQRTLGSKFTWICDAIDNPIKHAMGDAPNSEFVIDGEGRLLRKRSWSDAAALRDYNSYLTDTAATAAEESAAAEATAASQAPTSAHAWADYDAARAAAAAEDAFDTPEPPSGSWGTWWY